MGWPSCFEKDNEIKEEALALRNSLASPSQRRDWLGTGLQSESLDIRIEDFRSRLDEIITIINELLEFATDPAMSLVEEIQRTKRERDRSRRDRDQARRERDQAMRERDLLQLRTKPDAEATGVNKRRDDDSLLRDLQQLRVNELALKGRVVELQLENDYIKEQYCKEIESLNVIKPSEYRKIPQKVETKRQEAIDSQKDEFEALMEKEGVRRM